MCGLFKSAESSLSSGDDPPEGRLLRDAGRRAGLAGGRSGRSRGPAGARGRDGPDHGQAAAGSPGGPRGLAGTGQCPESPGGRHHPPPATPTGAT